MIYIFQQLPKATFPLVDLNKSFNNFSTNAEVAQRVQKISILRQNFYTIVNQIEKNAPNQIVTDLDWMSMFEYIQLGPDLLELGIKSAAYPFSFNNTSVLCPSKAIIISDDNEVAGTIEIILSRYCYALTVLKSVSGHLYQAREAIKNRSKDKVISLSKDIMDRIRNATIRIYKLWGIEAAILPGLKGRSGPAEFFPGFSKIMKRFFEVNYAAMMVEKVIIDDVKPEMIDILFELCQRQIHKIQELMPYFMNTPSDLSQSICTWLEVSNFYYRMISIWSLFLKNRSMVERSTEKTKDIDTIYYENNLLANAILDSKDYFVTMVKRTMADPNVVEFPKHGLSFFNDKMERELKKSITTYESIKGDLDIRKYAGSNIETLLAAGFNELKEDKIEKKLLEESGLTGLSNL